MPLTVQLPIRDCNKHKDNREILQSPTYSKDEDCPYCTIEILKARVKQLENELKWAKVNPKDITVQQLNLPIV